MKEITLEDVHNLIVEHVKDEERLLLVEGMRMDAIERDLRPIIKMYYAIVGSSAVSVFLMSIFIWIMVEKNTDIRQVQKELQTHSIQINETLTILKIKIQQDDARHSAIDRSVDNIHGHKN